MSRISSLTETTGFISPQSCCGAAAGGTPTCFGDEQDEVTTENANTADASAINLGAVINLESRRSLLRSQRLNHIDA